MIKNNFTNVTGLNTEKAYSWTALSVHVTRYIYSSKKALQNYLKYLINANNVFPIF